MRVIALFSLKGAPGVTTLACLLGAAWPGPGSAVLVEADPAGGDLAARFGLSSRVGWPTLRSAVRRSEEVPSLDPHLQELPGGLPVLVGARPDDRRPATSPEAAAVLADPSPPGLAGTASGTGRPPGVVIVDLGRLATDDPVSTSWLAASATPVLVVRGEVDSVVQVRERVDRIAQLCGGRPGIVVVGGGHSSRAVAEFTGLRPVGDLPSDPAAAGVATGSSGAARRLDRSPLWHAVGRVASTLAQQADDPATVAGLDVRPSDSGAWLPCTPGVRAQRQRSAFRVPARLRRRRTEGSSAQADAATDSAHSAAPPDPDDPGLHRVPAER